MTEQHTWRTVSSHHTSTGPIRYERCHCGAWRLASSTASGAGAYGSGRKWITSNLETAPAAPAPRR